MGFSVLYYMHGGMHNAANLCQNTYKTDFALRVTALFHLVMQTAFECIAFIPSLVTLYSKVVRVRGIQCLSFLRITGIAFEILIGSLTLSLAAIFAPRAIYSYCKANELFINKPCCSLLLELLPDLPAFFEEMNLPTEPFAHYEKTLSNFRYDLVEEMVKGDHQLEQVVVPSHRMDQYFKRALSKYYDKDLVDELFRLRNHKGMLSNFVTNFLESIATTIVKDSLLCPLHVL
jgi:hypothetical protein